MRTIALTCLLTATLTGCWGQQPEDPADTLSQPLVDSTNALPNHSPVMLNSAHMDVVDTQALHIYNAESLVPFFEKLYALEAGTQQKVRIAHVGDSHIQADFLTGRIREHFHHDFGNGGRGLIFPYKLAGTNGPLDFKITSTATWESKRNVFPNRPMDIGISGITLGTQAEEYFLQIRIDSADYFDSICVYHNGPVENPFTLYTTDDNRLLEKVKTINSVQYHKIRSGETVSEIAAKYHVSASQLRSWNGIRGNMIYAGKSLKIYTVQRTAQPLNEAELVPVEGTVTYSPSEFSERFNTPMYQAVLKYKGAKGHEINGIYVENGESGIVYSMIGVNGAKYEHYNKSKNFQAQFQTMNNDLVIIALGTNESLDLSYDSAKLETEFAAFVDELVQRNPESSFLISLNPDAYSRRNRNPNAARLNGLLKAACERRKLAYFDAFAVMRGTGGLYAWYKEGLANRDLVHLNAQGYYFMGDLFYYTLMDAYATYRATLESN